MPIVTVNYKGEHRTEVEEGTRLVHAVKNTGVEIGHRCGGQAKCTTCRVEVLDGEPEKMTESEAARLDQGDLTQVRLACQIPVEADMTVRPVMTVDNQPWDDPGPDPADQIEPDPVWTTKTAWKRA